MLYSVHVTILTVACFSVTGVVTPSGMPGKSSGSFLNCIGDIHLPEGSSNYLKKKLKKNKTNPVGGVVEVQLFHWGFCVFDWAAASGGERKEEESKTSQIKCDPNRGALETLCQSAEIIISSMQMLVLLASVETCFLF